jgi:hypothetical protein
MGVTITTRTAPGSKGSIVNTGVLFLVSPIGSGPSTPVLCQSIPDFEAAFTTRLGPAIPAWDYLDTFFREGGNQVYVINSGAPSASTTLSTALTTGAPITALAVAATTAAIPAGSQVILTSGANTQTFITSGPVASGVTSIPVNSQTPTFAFPIGSAVAPLNYTGAFSALTPDLGPGQIAVVGEPASANLYGAIQAHADGNNRIGLLDVLSTDASVTALSAEGALAQALTSKENVGVFGSWANVPAPAGVIGGTARQVPASAVIAALCNRVDQAGNPNRPAGGRDYPLQYVTSFVFDPVLAADQSSLKAKGVNFLHNAWGVLENYAFLTPLYTGTVPAGTPFWQLNCARARMWLKAQAAIIGENYYMKNIDAQGKLAGRLGSDLAAVLKQLYDAGGLYGVTPGDAYSVNVSASVNNNGTAATGTLAAVASAKFSPYADAVNITLVSVPVSGVVS